MSDAECSPAPAQLALVLIVPGLLLIAASFFPITFITKHAWTISDSDAFAQVTRELHSVTVSPPRRIRTAEEADLYREKLESEYERLSSKLTAAQEEPRRWSRWLLWAGAAITTAGAAVHLSQRSD